MKKYDKGITVGVFDLLHVGHLNLLERCKEKCDYLIVAVCDDEYVFNVKHTKPIVSLNDRVRLLSALKCVDEVVIVNEKECDDKLLLLSKIDFNVLFSGDDWKNTPRYKKTEEQFSEIGISIEYLPYTKGVSTTQIKQDLGNKSL